MTRTNPIPETAQMNRMTALLTALIATLALLCAPGIAHAADVVTLKDGTVLEGEIIQENDAYVVIKIVVGGIEQTHLKVRDEIASVERDTPQAAPDEADGRDTPQAGRDDNSSEDEDATIPDGVTRVAFLRLGERSTGKDMVGPFLNGNAIRESARILRDLPENQRPDVVVLHVDSGGGAVAELDDIIFAIQEDLKRDFRVVAWIKFAISGAAFTAMNAEEIVFESSGQMGGNVAFIQTPSGTRADRGDFLQVMLEYGRRVANNGRIDPKVMWAMQKNEYTLSADIDADGRVTWYDDDRGQYVVSAYDKVLTLNALNAFKFGISKGIADNKQELMEVLGVTEWVEVGEKADEYQSEFRDNVWKAQSQGQRLFVQFQIAAQAAQQARDEDDFSRQLGRAKRYLRQLRSLVRRAPSLERYMGMTPEWFDQMEEILRDIAEQANRQ